MTSGAEVLPGDINAKEARLQVRLDAEAKALLQRAASYRRESVSEFVLGTVLGEAERVVREHERIVLSEPDWQAFMAALDNPPEPNAALRRAHKQYTRVKSAG